MIIVSILLLISNLIYIGFDFETIAFAADFRFDDYFLHTEEFFKAIVSLATIVAVIFINKTILPFLCSIGLCALSEIYQSVIIFNNYDVQVYNYSSNTVFYTLVLIIVLCLAAYISTIKKKGYSILIRFSAFSMLFYLIACALPVALFDSFINLSLVIYYISLFLLLFLFGKLQSNKDEKFFNK